MGMFDCIVCFGDSENRENNYLKIRDLLSSPIRALKV
jgi:hypothetical protein